MTFPGLEMVDITPFLIVGVTDASGESRGTVVLAAFTGDPPGRQDELLARQIDTPEKFLRLLALLLSLGGAGDMADLLAAAPEAAGGMPASSASSKLWSAPWGPLHPYWRTWSRSSSASNIREGPPGPAGGL